MSQTLAAAFMVRAGVLPGKPDPTLSKVYPYSTAQLRADEEHRKDIRYHSDFAKLRAEAMDYFVQVSMPAISNWSELEFIWY
jgi:hypothetical protein